MSDLGSWQGQFQGQVLQRLITEVTSLPLAITGGGAHVGTLHVGSV
jgi:hypothetical protein